CRGLCVERGAGAGCGGRRNYAGKDDGEGCGPGLGRGDGAAERSERAKRYVRCARAARDSEEQDGGDDPTAGLWRAEEPDRRVAGLGDDGTLRCGGYSERRGAARSQAVPSDAPQATDGTVWAVNAYRAARAIGVCADCGEGWTEADCQQGRSERSSERR